MSTSSHLILSRICVCSYTYTYYKRYIKLGTRRKVIEKTASGKTCHHDRRCKKIELPDYINIISTGRRRPRVI